MQIIPYASIFPDYYDVYRSGRMNWVDQWFTIKADHTELARCHRCETAPNSKGAVWSDIMGK